MKNQLRKDVSCVFVCVVVAGCSSCQSCVGVFFCLDVCVCVVTRKCEGERCMELQHPDEHSTS